MEVKYDLEFGKSSEYKAGSELKDRITRSEMTFTVTEKVIASQQWEIALRDVGWMYQCDVPVMPPFIGLPGCIPAYVLGSGAFVPAATKHGDDRKSAMTPGTGKGTKAGLDLSH